jgi:hypothetical protein
VEYIIILKIIFSLIIILSSVLIYLKTNKLYTLSSHRGIKYFRNSFIYFTVAFAANIAIIILNEYFQDRVLEIIASYLIFNFTLAAGGFFLIYSLIWRDMEKNREYALFFLAFALAIVDYFYLKGIIYAAQLVTLGYGMIASYSSYKSSTVHNFRQIFFISIVLAFIGFAVNMLSIFLLPIFPLYWMLAYIITTSAFVLILYSVMRS